MSMLGSGADTARCPLINGLECWLAILVKGEPFTGDGFRNGSVLNGAGGEWARKLSLLGETMTWVEE